MLRTIHWDNKNSLLKRSWNANPVRRLFSIVVAQAQNRCAPLVAVHIITLNAHNTQTVICMFCNRADQRSHALVFCLCLFGLVDNLGLLINILNGHFVCLFTYVSTSCRSSSFEWMIKRAMKEPVMFRKSSAFCLLQT